MINANIDVLESDSFALDPDPLDSAIPFRFVDQLRFPIIAIGHTASYCSETFHIVLPLVISRLKGARWSRPKRRRLIEVLVYFSTYVLQRSIAARCVTGPFHPRHLIDLKISRIIAHESVRQKRKNSPGTTGKRRDSSLLFLSVFTSLFRLRSIADPFPIIEIHPDEAFAALMLIRLRRVDLSIFAWLLIDTRRVTQSPTIDGLHSWTIYFQKRFSLSIRISMICARIDIRFHFWLIDWSLGKGVACRPGAIYLGSTLVNINSSTRTRLAVLTFFLPLFVSLPRFTPPTLFLISINQVLFFPYRRSVARQIRDCPMQDRL